MLSVRNGNAPDTAPSVDAKANYLEAFPLIIDADLMERGQERYSVYCVPCHGSDGMGTGRVVQHGYPTAASFHTDRLQQAPVGYLFDVITRGYRNMPAFGNRIPPAERWAIVAHIRSLQLEANESFDSPLDEIIERLPVRDDAMDPTQPSPTHIPTDAGSGRFVKQERYLRDD